MSHSFPLAETAEAALGSPEPAARTRADAVRLASELDAATRVSGLETEWLNLSANASETDISRADEGVSLGFVQRYEDASGALVLAVTYWKLTTDQQAVAVEPEVTAHPDPVEDDHTDDLYFRAGRTKPRRRKSKPVDPNQMDLFGTSESDEP